jgi:hypothetical protein
MSTILGLDVSTSVMGVAIVDSEVVPDDKGSHILLLDSVDFTKGKKTLFEKADCVVRFFQKMLSSNGLEIMLDRIVLEEALMSFRPGMSSAMTISTLMKFNGIVSYVARNVFQKEPEYIGSGHARKLCGIKLLKTALGGPQKSQVFKHMREHDLKHVAWELKKNGEPVDRSYDTTDAYVVARAASICGPIVVVKKQKKQKVK